MPLLGFSVSPFTVAIAVLRIGATTRPAYMQAPARPVPIRPALSTSSAGGAESILI
jgi:hypothetical protein